MDVPQNNQTENEIKTSVPEEVAVEEKVAPDAAPIAPVNTETLVTANQAPEAEATKPDEEVIKPNLDDPSPVKEEENITWSASEFPAHEKTALWYLKLFLATIGASAILFLLTRSILTPVVVIFGAILLGIYGTHRPGQLEYMLSRYGIRVGSKQYAYDEFRLFIMAPESSFPEITLIPTKRFMPSLSISYAPNDETKIFNMLSEHLPFEERRPDFVDSLMRRIRF